MHLEIDSHHGRTEARDKIGIDNEHAKLREEAPKKMGMDSKAFATNTCGCCACDSCCCTGIQF